MSLTPPKNGPVYPSFLRDMAQETRSAYLKDLRDFARFCCGVERLETLEAFMFNPEADLKKVADAVRSYTEQMLVKGLSVGTVRRRLAAVRGLSRMANDLGVICWGLDSVGLSRRPRSSPRAREGGQILS